MMGFLDKILRRRRKQESDQLPEEAPPEQIVEDLPREARPEATASPGGPGPGEERGTGHPDAAGERE
jgi:hypothetical protein